MALTDENGGTGMVMPVAPMGNSNYGGWGYPVPMYGGYGNGGFGNEGDWSWIIVLFLFAALGGGFGGFGGGFGGYGDGAFPWLLASNSNTDNLINAGFNQSATASALDGIQNSITTGFSNAEVSGCNRAMDAMQTAYNNQIASMNQSFAQSQSLDNRLFDMQMAQQNCCCENRAGIADLRYTIATEACADRAAVTDALRDVLAANTASTQRVLDQLCQDKIDAKNEKIIELQNQLSMAQLAASQTAQTAQLLADNSRQTATLEDYLNPVARPAYIVQNPNCCTNTCGCGCGTF